MKDPHAFFQDIADLVTQRYRFVFDSGLLGEWPECTVRISQVFCTEDLRHDTFLQMTVTALEQDINQFLDEEPAAEVYQVTWQKERVGRNDPLGTTGHFSILYRRPHKV